MKRMLSSVNNEARRSAKVVTQCLLSGRVMYPVDTNISGSRRFQVFTSASSMVFNTFPCDDFVVDGESYLIADYSIACDTPLHSFFQAYAAVMVLVSRHLPCCVVGLLRLPPPGMCGMRDNASSHNYVLAR